MRPRGAHVHYGPPLFEDDPAPRLVVGQWTNERWMAAVIDGRTGCVMRQFAKDWADANDAAREATRQPVCQPIEGHPAFACSVPREDLQPFMRQLREELRSNPGAMVGDRVQVVSGETGVVESTLRGTVWIRLDGGQLKGVPQQDVDVISRGADTEKLAKRRKALGNPSVPPLDQWDTETDECDFLTYTHQTPAGHRFLIWYPTDEGCDSEGAWRAALMPRGAKSYLQESPPLVSPLHGVPWAEKTLTWAAVEPEHRAPSPKGYDHLKRKLMR